jgi:hypothetical protein
MITTVIKAVNFFNIIIIIFFIKSSRFILVKFNIFKRLLLKNKLKSFANLFLILIIIN